jgi:hypothetical protein
MRTVAEYRARAAQLRSQAATTEHSEDQAAMVAMALAFETVALRVERALDSLKAVTANDF